MGTLSRQIGTTKQHVALMIDNIPHLEHANLKFSIVLAFIGDPVSQSWS